jgi:hypothetical protein
MKSPIRRLTFMMVLIGAVGSLGLTLRAARNAHSLILALLFGVWVFSPFMGLAVAYILSNRWPVFTRNVLYLLSMVLTIFSLIIYAGIWTPVNTKPAFVFLVLPLLSWLLLAVVIPLTVSKSQKHG